ncbi:hypothetical protein ACFOGG_04460 [Brenneria rubrifaciens]
MASKWKPGSDSQHDRRSSPPVTGIEDTVYPNHNRGIKWTLTP